MKDILILGIETSCDETSAAVVANGRAVLSNIVSSQVDWHKKFGGVVPEIASRKHLEFINLVVDEALSQAGAALSDLTAIAVTEGPGLVGALLIGMSEAKALSYVTGLPLIGVNHLEGHIYANFLEHPELKPPFVSLVVSGGHTILVYVENWGKYEVLGETLDDAAGEAFDKIAKFLNLGYPGGPVIDKLAKEGNPNAIPFPRAMMKPDDYDFSLSGLKTAVLNYVSRAQKEEKEVNLADLVASFQAALVDVQVYKTIRATENKKVKKVVLAGGVAANTSLREKMQKEAEGRGFKLFYPSLKLCTDNAAMIAALGYQYYLKRKFLSPEANPNPNLSL